MDKSWYRNAVLLVLLLAVMVYTAFTHSELNKIKVKNIELREVINSISSDKEDILTDNNSLRDQLEEIKKELNITKKQLEDRNKKLQQSTRGNTNSTKISNKDKDGRKYRVETLTVTAYAPFDNVSGMCHDGNPNKTSTGTKPAHGTVAVNPKRFSYGTEFYIEGYGWGKALDTGGAMRQNSGKIDVFMDTSKQARNWGVRKVNVRVYE